MSHFFWYINTQRLCDVDHIQIKAPQPGGRGGTKQHCQNTETFTTVTFDQTSGANRINAIMGLPLAVTHTHAAVSGHYVPFGLFN